MRHRVSNQRGAGVLATLAGLVLLGLAAQALAMALGWSRLKLPLPAPALWLAAALACVAAFVLLLRRPGDDQGDLTPEQLAARGDFSDPRRLAGAPPAAASRTGKAVPRKRPPAATVTAPAREAPRRGWLGPLIILGSLVYMADNGALLEGWELLEEAIRGRASAPPVAVKPAAPPRPQAAVARPSPPPSPPRAAAAPAPAPVACGEATLHQAAAAACMQRLEQLLGRASVDIETRDARGLTPLAAAALADRVDAAELLLKARADVNARVRFAAGASPGAGGLEKAQSPERAELSTPLILARSAPMATLLLRHGADPLLKNDYGWSAIFYFTRNGNPAMIDILIAGGANINDTADVDPSHAGSTPLMWAAYMNLLPQLDALLRHRPRLDVRDRAGNTALDYATRFRHNEAIAKLKAAAAPG